MSEPGARHPFRRAGTISWRVLAGEALTCCVVFYVAGLLPGRFAGIVTILAGAVFFPAYLALRRAVKDAADLPDTRLDEREVMSRDCSYLLSYRIIGAVVAVSVVVAITADAADGLLVSWPNLWAALLLLAMVLPSAALAYTVQDPIDETV